MYNIDQQIANEIARSEKLKSPIMREIFSATEATAEKLENKLRKEIAKETGSDLDGRAAIIVLPLLLESEAITSYLNKTGRNLRHMLPEINDPKEGLFIAMNELPNLTPENLKSLMGVFRKHLKMIDGGNGL